MSLLKVYEQLERQRVAGSPVPSESEGREASRTSRQSGKPDPLADLLETPIRNLTAPLPVESSILGETIFLVANDSQAGIVHATGGIPYTSEEIALLRELYHAIDPEAWPERLRLIHEGKRHFGGTVESYTLGSKDPDR